VIEAARGDRHLRQHRARRHRHGAEPTKRQSVLLDFLPFFERTVQQNGVTIEAGDVPVRAKRSRKRPDVGQDERVALAGGTLTTPAARTSSTDEVGVRKLDGSVFHPVDCPCRKRAFLQALDAVAIRLRSRLMSSVASSTGRATLLDGARDTASSFAAVVLHC